MGDLILGIFLIAACYVGSVMFAIVVFKLFFPLNIKVAGQDESTYFLSERESLATKNKNYSETVGVGREWVKDNS